MTTDRAAERELRSLCRAAGVPDDWIGRLEVGRRDDGHLTLVDKQCRIVFGRPNLDDLRGVRRIVLETLSDPRNRAARPKETDPPKPPTSSHPGVKCRNGKWTASLYHRREKIELGSFATEQEAVTAIDRWADRHCL